MNIAVMPLTLTTLVPSAHDTKNIGILFFSANLKFFLVTE
jgi:hypothetical protein